MSEHWSKHLLQFITHNFDYSYILKTYVWPVGAVKWQWRSLSQSCMAGRWHEMITLRCALVFFWVVANAAWRQRRQLRVCVSVLRPSVESMLSWMSFWCCHHSYMSSPNFAWYVNWNCHYVIYCCYLTLVHTAAFFTFLVPTSRSLF